MPSQEMRNLGLGVGDIQGFVLGIITTVAIFGLFKGWRFWRNWRRTAYVSVHKYLLSDQHTIALVNAYL